MEGSDGEEEGSVRGSNGVVVVVVVVVADCPLEVNSHNALLVGSGFKRNWGSAGCQAGGQSYRSSHFGKSLMTRGTLLWVSLGTVLEYQYLLTV